MNTIDEFFEAISTILISPKFCDCSYPVFRGHSDGDYELKPTLQRVYKSTNHTIEKLENHLYCEFMALVGPRVTFKNSWEALYCMRHEGIPTRLLDWTENLGTALFFALDARTLKEPCVWVLNPYELNKFSSTKALLLDPEVDLEIEYHKSYVEKNNDPTINLHVNPLTIYPKRSNDRIFAQRGLFTIHGTDEQALDKIHSSCLEKIPIQSNIIPKLQMLLKTFGINKYSVYPDLKGLSEYLKEQYKY